MQKEDQKKEKRPLEFSKIIVILGIIMWVTVNVFGMVMMAMTQNLSPMVYIIASVDAVMACLTGWYSWKSKAENIVKLKSIYGIDITADLSLKSDNDHQHYYGKYNIKNPDESEDMGPMWEDTSIVG